jgi:hypothetical protein
LAVVNSASINMSVQVPLCILAYIPSDICPGLLSPIAWWF